MPRFALSCGGILVFVPLLTAAQPSGHVLAAEAAVDPKQPVAQNVAELGQLRGRVIHAASGKCAVGADVRLLEGIDSVYDQKRKKHNTTSNEQGEFLFEGISPGPNLIRATLGNESTRTQRYKFEKVVLDAQGRQTAPLELKLKEGVQLRVRVTSRATGKAIPDATLQFIWTDGDDGFKANEQGEIVVQALTAEQWHVQVSAPQHSCDIRDLKLTSPETVLHVSLPPGGEVTGRIVDDQGHPLAGAKLSIGVEHTAMYWLDRTTTNEQGKYRLQYLPLATPLSLNVSREGFKYSLTTLSVDAQTPVDYGSIKLTPLPDGGKVVGQVVDNAGQPIVGTTVENYRSSSVNNTTYTDNDGRFQIDRLYFDSVNRVILTIRDKGFTPRQIELSENERQGVAPVKIALDPGHRIRGRVLDQAGNSIAGCRVWFADGNRGAGGIGGLIDADSEGRFESDALPPDCPFSFKASGYSELENAKLPLDGEDEVVVQLEPIAHIRGRVLDAKTEKPIGHFNVRLNFPSGQQPRDKRSHFINSTRIDPGEDFVVADGRFELQDLANGCVWDVVVRAQGYQPLRLVRVESYPGESAESIDVKLQPNQDSDLVKVAGTIVGPDGKFAAGVQVHLMGLERQADGQPREAFFTWPAVETGSLESSYDEYRKAVTNEQGAFAFDGVPKQLALRLLYWSDQVPADRLDDLDAKSRVELAQLQLTHAAPATIRGAIDRGTFPDAVTVTVHGDQNAGGFKAFRSRQIDLNPDQTEFEITGLQAGSFHVALCGKLHPNEKIPGSYTQDNLAWVPINPAAGETVKVRFDGEARRKLQR